ncbi:methyl farnesoate epoxidase-like [Neocloeon triangulifer]|uniref:methyl farnesoate epoxidase-like n=1 Tax=Neocloeon triangulifer TaxID=2078957 RepID=UPI00286EBC47|nr:methyl farnesoate epoxidase-like [Neocloeon triangulifer]
MLLQVVACALILFCSFAVWGTIKPKGFPPGPCWCPFVGCYPQFLFLHRILGYCHLVWAKWAEQYGPLVGLKLGKDRIVVVSGYQAVKHVFSRDDCDGRPDGFFFRMRTFDQRLGLVFVDGEHWSKQRKFTTRHLRNLGLSVNSMEHIILQEVEALVHDLSDKCSHNEDLEIELHNLCDISILNSLWAVVAGNRFELDDPRLIQMFKLQHASFRALDMSGGLINQMPFLRHLMPGRTGYNDHIATLAATYSFLRETLQDHKRTHMQGNHHDLIDAYLDEINSEKDTDFNDLQLLALSMDLFMAGSETTSNTIGFIFLYFLINPEMQKRVQAEIDSVIGRGRLPKLSDRPKMLYLEALIMEVQRFLSVAPIAVPHRTTQDCEILGYNIPKDTTVLMSIWSVHMDPEHWKDPENFRPERFLNEDQSAIIKDEWFIPFGLGKRRCIGEVQARNSLFLFLAGLLQRFTFSATAEGVQNLKHYDGVTLSPKPYKGIVKRR